MSRFSKDTQWKPPAIEHLKLTDWGWLVSKPQYLELGRNTDIGAFTYINAAQGVTIKNDVQIGPHCSILTVNAIDHTMGEIIILEGACIGAHSVVLPKEDGTPLVIGYRAKCGAYSLIKDDVPDNAFVKGGNHKARLHTNI